MIVYDKQILNIEDYAIKHDFYGRDTLSFYIREQHVQYKDITPLMVLHCRDDNQRYIVRKMDSGDVVADLDLTDLQAQMYVPYKSASGTAADIVSSVLPEGWELVDDTTLANRKTIELESATPLEIIEEVCNQFDIAVRYDNTKHIVRLVNPSISTTTTAYFTDELNLKNLATTVTTDEYATRLYAYGAEGLSFADINEGKPYVDAPSVSDGAPVVCTYWSDDRYTVKENLLQAAKDKIAELSTPQSSYELSVVDLAKIRPDEYGFLSVHLYDRVPLLDRKSNRRAVHQVIEYTEYPNYPTRNEIVLSTLPQSIQRTVSQVKDTVDNVTRPDGSLVADKIAGYINGAMASLRAQYNVADKQDVLAILFENLDETSEMYGALAIGTQGIMISKQRNADGSGWVWTTAITYAGIMADTIVTGLLSSKSGNSWLNLDTGLFNFNGNLYIGEDGKARLKCDSIEMLDGDFKFEIRDNKTVLPQVLEAWKKLGFEITDPSAAEMFKGQAINFLEGDDIIASLNYAKIPIKIGDLTEFPILTLYSKGFIALAPEQGVVGMPEVLANINSSSKEVVDIDKEKSNN